MRGTLIALKRKHLEALPNKYPHDNFEKKNQNLKGGVYILPCFYTKINSYAYITVGQSLPCFPIFK